jgi:hypothetical protein
MSFFSVVFSGIFLAFIVAAVAGHVLLIQALVRPFSDEAASNVPLPVPSLQPGL